MKSILKPVDLFCFFEMLHEDKVKARMNELTYKKIIASPYGIDDFENIENIRPSIWGVSILFDEEMQNDDIEIIAEYINPTRKMFFISIKD